MRKPQPEAVANDIIATVYTSLSKKMRRIIEEMGLDSPKNMYQRGQLDILLQLERAFNDIAQKEGK